MDRAGVGEVCLALPGTALDHPFGEGVDVYKVGGKMFVMADTTGGVSFKVSDIAYEALTETGQARPAPYMARAKWVNLLQIHDWADQALADHIVSAHAIVAGKLPKRIRVEHGL